MRLILGTNQLVYRNRREIAAGASRNATSGSSTGYARRPAVPALWTVTQLNVPHIPSCDVRCDRKIGKKYC